MKKMTAVITLASSVMLAACGETDGTSGSAISSTTINSMSVQGSAAAVAGVIPLNSGINEGAFTVNWNVSSSDPYHVRLYVSDDATLSSNDIQFFSQNCGSLSSLYNCGKAASFACSFDTQNQIVCNESSYNRGKNLTSFLQTLPQDAYLIMYACNGLFDSCKTEEVAIELQ